MSHGRYILEGKIPVPCEDLLVWGRWCEEHHADCVVKQEFVGELWVSTVFLCLDHNHFGNGPPDLFETMIFRDANEHDRQKSREYGFSGNISKVALEGESFFERTSTWELALEQHAEAVAWVKDRLT